MTWRLPQVRARVLEQVALELGRERILLDALRNSTGAKGVFYLSTCQRVVFALSHARIDGRRFAQLLTATGTGALPPPETLTGHAALLHLAEVAASLDALVPGETQILHQFRTSIQRARHEDRLDRDMDRWLTHALRAARHVRKETGLSGNKESLLPLTQDIITNHLQGASRPDVAVLGTGTMAKAAVRLVNRIRPDARLTVVSRDPIRAQRFTRQQGGQALGLDGFLRMEHPWRLVVLAMRSDRPVLSTTYLERAARHEELLVLDLALPRNAQHPEKPVPGLQLIGLDRIAELAQRSPARGSAALTHARKTLHQSVQRNAAKEQELVLHDAVQDLDSRFHQVAEERWQKWTHRASPAEAAHPDFRKWFEQTVRALRHEAILHAKRESLEANH